MNKFSELVTEMEHLYELRDVPVAGWESIYELVTWLMEDLGYEYVNSGSYTLVYEKGDYVVKVQRPKMPTTLPMKCAIRFHRMALKSNNPHLPKVYFVKVYKDKDGTHKYVFGTEKLYKIDHYVDPFDLNPPKEPKQAAIFVAFLAHHVKVSDYSDAVFHIKRLIGQYNETSYRDDTDRVIDLADKWRLIDHPLVTAYEQVIRLLDDEQCFTDFELRNVMQRKDGTVVFSDPIADFYWS